MLNLTLLPCCSGTRPRPSRGLTLTLGLSNVKCQIDQPRAHPIPPVQAPAPLAKRARPLSPSRSPPALCHAAVAAAYSGETAGVAVLPVGALHDAPSPRREARDAAVRAAEPRRR